MHDAPPTLEGAAQRSRGRAAPTTVPTPAAPRAPWLGLAYLALALLLAAPLLGLEAPPGGDTLNHLARIHVRAHLADDPDLARLFALRDRLVPYMGLDWLAAPLARVMPTLDAGRAVVVLLLWGTVGAVAVLQRAVTGRFGWEPLLMGLVSWNALLASGFLNYMVGVICALLGLAAWHALRERGWLPRLAVFTAVATGMYFVHLLGLALYGVLVGSYEAFGRPRAWRTPMRDWLLLAAQFVPAGVLWLQLAMPEPPGGPGVVWLPDLKVIGLMSPFTFYGAWGGIGVGMALTAGAALLLFWLTRAGALRWDRRLAAPAAALMLAGLLAPTWALGVYLVDLRFSGVAACLAIAALRVAPGARLLPMGVLLGVLAVEQAGAAGAGMRACNAHYAELRAALQALPRGAVLGAVLEQEPAPGIPCSPVRVYDQMAQLVTLERSGYNPGFFAAATPVVVRAGLLTDTYPTPAHKAEAGTLPQGNYLLWMHLGHRRPVPPGLALLRAGSFFDLYRVE